jgi:hypothetical protein
MDFCGCSVISFIVFPLRNDCMLLISCLLVDVLQEKTTYFPYISISKHHVFGCSLTISHLCREGISDITYHLSFTTGISKNSLFIQAVMSTHQMTKLREVKLYSWNSQFHSCQSIHYMWTITHNFRILLKILTLVLLNDLDTLINYEHHDKSTRIHTKIHLMTVLQ